MNGPANIRMLSAATAKGHVVLRDVDVRYGDGSTIAVKRTSLHIEPGEFVSIIGPSGCGKSTLLNVIGGFVSPSGGTAEIDGRPIVRPGADRGVVFQQDSLFPWMSVRKNIEFGLKMQGIGRAERAAQAQRFLQVAGLGSFGDHLPHQLSGGMKQRVGIMRSLAINPQVLLMDEPFGALDAQTRTVMQEVLTDIWQKFKISVLFITHDIEESIFLSDRIYVMTARPGSIKATIAVPLPRPRTAEMTTTAEFFDLKVQLKELIREESLKAMSSEIEPGTARSGH